MQNDYEFAVYPEWVYEGGSGDSNKHMCVDKLDLLSEIIELLTNYDSPKELYSIRIDNLNHHERKKD